MRPVKRKGSDQRKDEVMEARGRNREEWEVQAEPRGLYARSNLIVLCTIFMGIFFLS